MCRKTAASNLQLPLERFSRILLVSGLISDSKNDSCVRPLVQLHQSANEMFGFKKSVQMNAAFIDMMGLLHTPSTPAQLITKEEAIQERPDAFASLIEKHQ